MARFDLNQFLADVEQDLAWRQSEVRELKRAVDDALSAEAKKSLRRAFVALLYAHIEGGAKFMILAYVRYINEQKLAVGDCNPFIVALSHGDLFRALSDSSQKHGFFRNKLPDDLKLHRMARQAEFISRTQTYEELPIRISDEDAADTEGNIDQVVLSKILFRLGFGADVVEKRFTDLQFLRHYRNQIAHGERNLVSAEKCEKYTKAVLEVLKVLKNLLAQGIRSHAYRRRGAA